MTNTENLPTGGLILSVLRPAESGDCTNGGITAQANRVTLVGTAEATDVVFPIADSSRCVEPNKTRPAVALEIRKRFLGTGKVGSLVPVQWDAEVERYVRAHSWSMAGGNYASTSDSRFGDLVETVLGFRAPALAVHDRIES